MKGEIIKDPSFFRHSKKRGRSGQLAAKAETMREQVALRAVSGWERRQRDVMERQKGEHQAEEEREGRPVEGPEIDRHSRGKGRADRPQELQSHHLMNSAFVPRLPQTNSATRPEKAAS